MKKILFSIFLSIIIVFGLSGCYTIIWSPDTEFPNEENSDNSTVYYGDSYYGDYYFWYDVPWWYDYAPPVSTKSPTDTRDNNSEANRLRDTGNGRGESGRIIDVQPPSRDQGQTGNNSNKGSSGNSGNTSGNTSTRNSSSDSGSSSGSSNSSGSGSTRNSDGGRSSDGRR